MSRLNGVLGDDAFPPMLTRDLEPCLWYPERLVWPNSWAAHIPFAFWITRTLHPMVLVELGVHTGNSYAAFCQAVKLAGTSTTCFGVDTWRGDEHTGLYGDEIYNELLNWHDARYENFSRLIRSTFDGAVDYFSPGTIDLLHIDGLHTYEAVRHDFETWRPNLSDRAVVLFHDTNVRERNFGVWRFWSEVAGEYPSFEFLHGHGLGVLGLGANLPASLSVLFEAGRMPGELRQVRDLFTRLGTPLMRDIQLATAKASVVRATEAEHSAFAASEEAKREATRARKQAEREVAAAERQAERVAAAARGAAALAASTAAAKVAQATADAQRAGRMVAEACHAAEIALQDAADARASQAEAEARLAAILSSTTWKNASRLHAVLANKPRLRSFLRRSAKLVWWTVSLQLFARLVQRRSHAPRVAGLNQSVSVAEEPCQPAPIVLPALASVTLQIQRIDRKGTTQSTALTNRPLVVYLSHVSPYPSRAGNEYRIQRMLAWLSSKGWDVVFLYCPLSGEEPDEPQLSVLKAACDNLVYIHRDGLVQYSVTRPDLEAVIASLDGCRTRDVAGLLDEASQPTARLLGVIRSFSVDALVEVTCAIDDALAPKIVLANYVFMTRGLPLLRGGALKIVDTIDLFSAKSARVTPFGVADGLDMSETEEAHLLSHADLVLAIQPGEAAELRRIAPGAQVLTVGVDMNVDMTRSTLTEAPIVLLVASGNPMNAKGLRDFLRFAWPRVLRAVPEARLHVIGSVGDAVPGDEPDVLRLGMVEDLGQAYSAARIVINPAVAGTGIKIKTLEALANLRPLVTWPTGLDGVSPDLAELCECATDWYAFSEALIRMLNDDDAAQRVIAHRERIAEMLSPHVVFAELDGILTGRHAHIAE